MRTQKYDRTALGVRLKKARERLRLTQEYIGEQINVGTQHISNIECGAVGISIDTLMNLCDVLDVTTDYALYGTEAAHSGNMLYQTIKELGDKDRVFIEDFVELYLKRLGKTP
jgi:transcriptional regulator with XRE-family HTH domain